MDKLLKRAQTNLESKFRRGGVARGAASDVNGSNNGDSSPTATHVPKIRTPMRALPLKKQASDAPPGERESSPTAKRLSSALSSSTERLRKSAIPMRASQDFIARKPSEKTAVTSSNTRRDADVTAASSQHLAPRRSLPSVGDSPSILSARRLHEEVHPGARAPPSAAGACFRSS